MIANIVTVKKIAEKYANDKIGNYDGYQALLVLTEHGKKKTWLLTGHDIDENLDKKRH